MNRNLQTMTIQELTELLLTLAKLEQNDAVAQMFEQVRAELQARLNACTA
jgi:hypothetical protein